MTVEQSTREQTPTAPPPSPLVDPTVVDPTVATLAAIQRQLAEQTHLLRVMQQELMELRTTQVASGTTIVKLERQMRWTRWVRRIRSVLFALFWLGVALIIAYYWTDLSVTWNYWTTILRDF